MVLENDVLLGHFISDAHQGVCVGCVWDGVLLPDLVECLLSFERGEVALWSEQEGLHLVLVSRTHLSRDWDPVHERVFEAEPAFFEIDAVLVLVGVHHDKLVSEPLLQVNFSTAKAFAELQIDDYRRAFHAMLVTVEVHSAHIDALEHGGEGPDVLGGRVDRAVELGLFLRRVVRLHRHTKFEGRAQLRLQRRKLSEGSSIRVNAPGVKVGLELGDFAIVSDAAVKIERREGKCHIEIVFFRVEKDARQSIFLELDRK